MPGKSNPRHEGNRRGNPRGGSGTPQLPPMKSMPSPYNFVAVEDQVAPPIAPGTISHDTPFKEGLSGWLDIEVEATTPIYIRAAGDFRSYRKAEGSHDSQFVQDCRALVGNAAHQLTQTPAHLPEHFKAFTDFYRLPDGRPAIPGTSLRGVVRNLLEILTNSRLGPVNERRYAVRDLNNRPLFTGWMSEIDGGAFVPKVRAGWLRKKDGTWCIQPCQFARVEQTHLEGSLGKKASLAEKYIKLRATSLPTHWKIGDMKNHEHSLDRKTQKPKLLRYRKAVPATASEGGIKGTLVLTGQPSNRNDSPQPFQSRGKHMEFVFFDESQTHVEIANEKSPRHRKEFLETHTDELGNPTEAWKHWKPKFESGEAIPIFYLAYASASDVGPDKPTVSLETPGAHLHAFGLAMMFRLAYRHTLREAVPASHREDRLAPGQFDFVESLFGYQREKADEGLRGRVSFGPCAASKDVQPLPPVVTVLSAPKPTYYPNYLEQPFDPKSGRKLAPGKAYATLMDDEHQRRLRGWKFYPAHSDGIDPATAEHAREPLNGYNGGDAVPLPPKNSQDQRAYKTATAFRPLPGGTKFTGRLRFHNLRAAELGALVWALSWGGNENLRHRIGMAKPLGYGCAKIRIAAGRVIPNDPSQATCEWDQSGGSSFVLNQALQAFETMFATRLKSPAIQKDLLSMADPNHGHTLRYPTLDPRNEFADAKKHEAQLVLRRWRVLNGESPGNPVVDKTAPPKDGGGGSAGIGIPRHTGPHSRQQPAGPTRPVAKFSLGQNVECEVIKKQPEKQKATLKIVAGGSSDTGGLHPDAKPRFSELPEVEARIVMKIGFAGADGYQFLFPDQQTRKPSQK